VEPVPLWRVMAQIAFMLWPLILISALLLVLVRPLARLIFAVLGLIFFFAVDRYADLGGPDSPGLILPFLGLLLIPAALIAEALSRFLRLAKRKGWLRRNDAETIEDR
jgi:hypothetical protein